MRYALYDRCSRALAALIFVAASCAVPAASAEIFKCTTKDGTPLYQNFPCQFDSLGWQAPSSQTVKVTQGSQITRVAAKSPSTNEIRIGMTADEVRALLGEPEEMVGDEPAEGGPVSLWRYANGRSVRFDLKHRVSEVEQ